MKKRRVLVPILCVILVIAVLAGGYVYHRQQQASLVISCNQNEISAGLYNLYMVTEAALMDRTQYESDEAFLEDLHAAVLDQICIDTYYATKCKEEEYTLTLTEKANVEMELVAKMVELGFDYDQYNNNDAYLEYFNVSKADFLEFYTRQSLYNKYFLAMAGQTQEISDDLRSEYQKFTERQKAYEKIQAYRESINILNENIGEYFDEHRYEYAKNYIDVVFMKYPADENGVVSEDTKAEYERVASRVLQNFQNGMFIHQFKETFNTEKEYVTSAGKMYVDNSNAVLDLYGEEFVRTCLDGRENRIYQVNTDYGIAIFKVLEVNGEEGYWNEMALIIKTKEMGNKVRKAILQDEYEPIVLNQELYDSLQTPSGTFWQNLLEK